MNHFNRLSRLFHIRQRLLFRLFLLLVTVSCLPQFTTLAQTVPGGSYWRVSASLRIDHLLPVDITGDGIHELIVIAENGEIELLGADGISLWSYEAGETVLAVGTANVHGPDRPQREIIVAVPNRLLLLSSDGKLLWETAVDAVTPPPSLLHSSSREAAAEWGAQYPAIPAAVGAIDRDQDGRDEIVLLLRSGQVQLFSADGAFLWRYARGTAPGADAQPQMIIDDLDQDGRPEIVVAFFRRFTLMTILNGDGEARWEQAAGISGRVSTLQTVDFAEYDGRMIAIGTDRGDLSLYNAERRRIWLRTLNRPITALAVAQLPTGPVLLAGTSTGVVTGYNGEGRRVWTRQLSGTADNPIIAISPAAAVPDIRQPLAAVIIGSGSNRPEQNDILLLGSNGRTLTTLTSFDTSGLSRLTDINGDQHSELLLARFATVELQGMGIGANKPAREWNESLDAAPRALVVVDINQDGRDELLVGAQNGSIRCFHNDGRLCWLTASGEPITHMALLSPITGFPSNIVVVRNRQDTTPGGEVIYQSWLETRQPTGDLLRDDQQEPLSLPTEITALLVDNVGGSSQPEIIIGTRDGNVLVYSAAESLLWSAAVQPDTSLQNPDEIEEFQRIIQLLVMRNEYTDQLEIVAVTPRAVYKINPQDEPRVIINEESGIYRVYPLSQPGGDLAVRLLVITQNGLMRAYHWDGIQLSGQPQYRGWPLVLGGSPISAIPANDLITEVSPNQAVPASTSESFLVATDAAELLRITIEENQPGIAWRRNDINGVTHLYWGDLDGDVLPDIAAAVTGDRIHLFSNGVQNPQYQDELMLSSGVFDLTVMTRSREQPDLLVATRNGEIELFRAQENRPPLLTHPRADAGQSQYAFSIAVNNADQDEVTVDLQIYDPADENQSLFAPDTWASYGANSTNRSQRLSWPAITPPDHEQLHYSFRFNDGSHVGRVTPPPLPSVTAVPPLVETSPALLGMLAVVGLATAVLLAHQWRQPAAQARRFYRKIQQQPQNALPLLEDKYVRTNGSQEFLLYLAGQARQQGNQLLSSLADGLFLIADRPRAGLPIIIGALEEASQQTPGWYDVTRWLNIFTTGQALLEAPSITELGLLRPKLTELLEWLKAVNERSPILDALFPILTNLRDSDRVEEAEDRLVYLNEAMHLLYVLHASLSEQAIRIETALVTAVYKRWYGLVSAETEELRGRAELTITLKTKRIIPISNTEIVIEIKNNGRAPAENITLTLNDDPAYRVKGPPQTISFLSPGRARQFFFPIEPMVTDRFRIGLTVTYDDRNQLEKQEAFGDMVHLLPPARSFKPIANPYLPGTPLRRNSNVFYGREQLFRFIAENTGGAAQQNVLILIGQRRTGKTSALLRLQEHLPDYLLPVYIDCQSLGIVPGIPAFLFDLAWLIADVLAEHDIELQVPEMDAWKANPTGLFQREFLPQVQALLPDGVKLLLVFDEFEAFENLVEDQILPPTFFAFMRHLMQHSKYLGFVFVGTRRLEEMSADYWSVLFNIALYERIRYLNDASAIQLITEPVAPHLTYDDLAIDKILRVTAGHPYFLQLACYTLVKQANTQQSGYITISDVNAALDEMLGLGEVHFAYLWQRSTYTERALLTAVSHLMDRSMAFHPEDLMAYLEQVNIQLDPIDVTAALNRLVEREIMREVSQGATTLYELKIGLVGLWIAKHKSLSKLHATESVREERPLAESI